MGRGKREWWRGIVFLFALLRLVLLRYAWLQLNVVDF
jgi:hypothetical protein